MRVVPVEPFRPEMAANVRRQILEAVIHQQHRAVLVDSPPGAGKTDLVEAVVAAAAAHARWRVAVLTPRVEQANDVVRRLCQDYQIAPVTLLHSAERTPPADLTALGASTTTNPNSLPTGPGVVVATAKKMQMAVPVLQDGHFDLLAFDEAYQLAWKEVAPLLQLGRRALLVGDPGQLPPLIRADVAL